jgi:type II secretory pathway pseudopilin PulG
MVKPRAPQHGVVYLALLLAVAMVAGATAAVASVLSHAQQREREKQLLWAGDQIRQAIAGYAQAGADAAGNYPAALQDLLQDPRTPAKRRFLRQIYDDPMTRGRDWGLVRNGHGQIVGVYSRSDKAPVKTAGFAQSYAHFEHARRYADWTFTAVPQQPAAPSGPVDTDRASRPRAAGSDASRGAEAPVPAAAPDTMTLPKVPSPPAAPTIDPPIDPPADPSIEPMPGDESADIPAD